MGMTFRKYMMNIVNTMSILDKIIGKMVFLLSRRGGGMIVVVTMCSEEQLRISVQS